MLRRIRVVRWRSGVVSPVAVTAARSVYAGSWPMCPSPDRVVSTSRSLLYFVHCNCESLVAEIRRGLAKKEEKIKQGLKDDHAGPDD